MTLNRVYYKNPARIPEKRIVFGIVLGLTVLFALFMILLGLDWITDNGISIGLGQFVVSSLGFWVLMFLLYGARYVFAVFGLLLMMFLPKRKEKTLALPE